MTSKYLNSEQYLSLALSAKLSNIRPTFSSRPFTDMSTIHEDC